MKCVEVYKELYHQEPFDVAFCPYRISPLGAHIDHQYGKINGLAIDKGIHMAYHPKQNGVVELQSLNFPKRAQFFVSAVPEEKQGDWADHLRGATKMLGEKYRLKVGLSGIIEGSLPIGGLSSSASVIICFLSALCKVNGVHLEPMEMILTAKAAENQYVGVSCGKLDQSCEVLSKKNHLLYLDTKDDSYELIPTSEKMKPYKVAIFFSGLERSLKNSKYNLRQDECKAAAYALMGYAGMDYDTFANTRLRDVPYEVFEAYKDRLPELWRRRAEHYYSEFARAEKGAELWRKGDLDGYGQLVFESGKSSIYSYECGCDELKKLYEIMVDTDGIYGGRFSGAGFKGCCMALIAPDKAEDIEAKVSSEYLKAFPALEGKYSLILFIPLVATSIYRMMDKVMLGNFSTMQQVGFYENSEKLINVCLCVISAFGAVMMPRMSNLYARSKYDECRDLFVRSMEIAIFIGCAITFGISSIANDFIPIFYGTGYDACVSITIMLSATVLFITWACIVRTLYLIPTEKNKVYIYSVFLGAGVNVIINWALIPRLASVGAAVGTIIAEVTVAVYQTIMVRKELDVSQCMKKSVPFIIFGSIMFLVVKILPFEVGGNIGRLIAKIFIGAMVYLALSAIYFLKTKNKLFYDVIGKLMKI